MLTATPICNTATQRCVQCVQDSECSGSTPACNTATNTCVQCNAAVTTQCTGTTTVCDTPTNTCVQCIADAQCTGGQTCRVNNMCM